LELPRCFANDCKLPLISKAIVELNFFLPNHESYQQLLYYMKLLNLAGNWHSHGVHGLLNSAFEELNLGTQKQKVQD